MYEVLDTFLFNSDMASASSCILKKNDSAVFYL